MDKEQKRLMDERGYYIVKNNELAQKTRFNIENPRNKALSVLEQRIFLYLVSKIKPEQQYFEWEELSIPEFCKVFRINKNNHYATIKKTISEMASRVLWLVDNENNVETIVRLIGKAKLDHMTGKIYLKLDDDMRPYLLNQIKLKGYYQYPLIDVINFKCKYSFILYEIFCSYANYKRKIGFSIEDLKERLECQNYNITNFKTKVIDRAIEEINRWTVFTIEVEYIKDSKQISDIIFNIGKKETLENIERIIDLLLLIV